MKIDFKKAYNKVRWNFVEDVLIKRGSPVSWIKKTMHTIQSGRVCININGQRSQYFKTYQGLRKGDPFSLIMFNLVAEVLSQMMDTANSKNLIRGILPNLVFGCRIAAWINYQ